MSHTLNAQGHSDRGVSLIEVMISVVIVLVLAAITVPAVLRTLHIIELNGVATSVANIINRARYEAVKLNTPISCRQTTIGTLTAFYVDLNNNSSMENTEPVVTLPAAVAFASSGYPASSTMGYPATTVPTSSTAITFTERGVPSFGTVYTYFLVHINPNDGYRCVAINAMGKIKVWRAAGSNWVYP